MRAVWLALVVAVVAVLGAGCQSILGISETVAAPSVDAPLGEIPDAAGHADGAGAADAHAVPDAAGADAAPCTGTCGALGCCAGTCCQLVPSNTALFGPLASVGMVKEVPEGMTFDTKNDCVDGSILGDCGVRSGACVCGIDDLIIHGLQVKGPNALVILASESVTIAGELRLSGQGAINGPGAAGALQEARTGDQGGSGGSFGSFGGPSATGQPLGLRGNVMLTPLLGGAAGQGACNVKGGGGGGALQISAGTQITVGGSIAIGGGGGGAGDDGTDCNGGAGGGSGGGVLLEAASVLVTGSILANGGGGGSGGTEARSGTAGDDAHIADTEARGGSSFSSAGCPENDPPTAGSGGNGAIDGEDGWIANAGQPAFACPVGMRSAGDGGGGGGEGIIRVNSAANIDGGGAFSPLPTYGTPAVSR